MADGNLPELTIFTLDDEPVAASPGKSDPACRAS